MEKVTVRSPLTKIRKEFRWTIEGIEERKKTTALGHCLYSPWFEATGSDGHTYAFVLSVCLNPKVDNYSYLYQNCAEVSFTSRQAIMAARFDIFFVNGQGGKNKLEEGTFRRNKVQWRKLYCLLGDLLSEEVIRTKTWSEAVASHSDLVFRVLEATKRQDK